MPDQHHEADPNSIAIIGMSCRFPGADNADAFWKNLAAGIESIRDLSESELAEMGVSAELVRNPAYVRRSSRLQNMALFDAPFFDFTAREASITAPAQRMLLMCAHEAFEAACYQPKTYAGSVGVFVGANRCDEWQRRLHALAETQTPEFARQLQHYIANDLDYSATRISYKLNLTGPSFTISTACSTSLVAVHQACRALLSYECDMALAGGASITLPLDAGYLHEPGGIMASDGRCRAFDARSDGTIFGNGAGVVLLKRLEDAVADRDHIVAVIRGSAINNDGAAKVGYTAPSVRGQAQVIATALTVADLQPDDISYVETHGTGTKLGDPIEIEALSKAYGAGRARCALGSVKTNIGHLGSAAGIAGLIKTVQGLRHRQIAPSLHFERPNPEIDIDNSRFFVNTGLLPWESVGGPLRAGVSSFGVGGTNAHIILEEAPPQPASTGSRQTQLLLLSAKSVTALDKLARNLAEALVADPALDPADVAFSLNTGRERHALRRAYLIDGTLDAIQKLQQGPAPAEVARDGSAEAADIAFMFPGQGSQYIGMCHGLYRQEKVFRETVDLCADLLRPWLNCDIRAVLYPGLAGAESAGTAQSGAARDEAEAVMLQTRIAQPALFVVEYALACQWRSWGIHPGKMIGHSIGEYVAACLSGVFSLEDALFLVAERGRLMQSMPAGAMLAVAIDEASLLPLLAQAEGCDLAAVNAPGWCVAAGAEEAIGRLEAVLAARSVVCRRIHTSHAFHSRMMAPILDAYRQVLQKVILKKPRIPFLSNVSGDWIRDDEASDANYWVKQLRGTVRFYQGISRLLDDRTGILLEAGPGQTLTQLVKTFNPVDSRCTVLASCRQPNQALDDQACVLNALGATWVVGADICWSGFYQDEQRLRLSLPTYPFEGARHWLERRHREVQATLSVVLSTAASGVLQPASAAGALPSRKDAVALKTLLQHQVRLLLGTDAVDDDVALIELGMSSLMAIELRGKVNAALGCECVSVVDLLGGNASINALAQSLAVKLSPQGGEGAVIEQTSAAPLADKRADLPVPDGDGAESILHAPPGIHPDPDNAYQVFPLTDIQQAYWIGRHGTNDGGSAAAYTYFEIDIHDVHLQRFEQALNQLIQRHATLRMIVHEDGTQQILRAVPEYRIECVDWSPATEAESARNLDAKRATLSRQAFDSSAWPLFSLQFTKIKEDLHRLHFGSDLMIFDVLSLQVFCRDLFLFYIGESKRLAPLEINFRDYVLAEKRSQSSEQYQKARRYWLARMDTLPAAPQLAYAKEATQIQAPQYARRDFEIDSDTWSRLKDIGRRKQITPSILIANLFSEVLAQWCSAPTFTLNLTTFNRPALHPQINELIGNFTSSVLLEVDMSQRAPFTDSAKRLQAQLLNDLEHRQFSGVEMLRAINSRLGGYQTRIMPVVLTSALGIDQHGKNKLDGLTPQQMRTHQELTELAHGVSQTPQVWLDHIVREKNGALLCDWYTLDELFPERLMDDMFCTYYDRLIELANAGDRAWQAMPAMLLPAYQQRQRVLVNQTQAPVCQETLQALFQKTASEQPDKLAVINRSVHLSYRDLHVLATQLGERLRKTGAKPNQLVAVLMDKGWEQIAAVLGILYSGAAYMPVDAALPAERILHLLQQGEVTSVLTQSHLLGVIAWPAQIQPFVIDERLLQANRQNRAPPLALPVMQTSADLAYVLFTSGSTGIPKGVMIDHQSAVNTVLDINRRFQVSEQDRVLAINALNFDLSVYDIFGLLFAGGTLVIPDYARALDPVHWAELARDEHVTLWNTVPAIAQLYVDALEGLSAAGGKFHPGENSIRLVFMSGDWIPVGLPERIRHALPSARLISLGGPTETTVWSICYPIEKIDPCWKSIPYGKSLENRSHYILHADLTPCPDWVTGEIYTGGRIGVSKGYWRDEEKTDQVFIVHPETGERLCRTGDLGRFRPDGNIEFMGRVDHQVKLHGYRIELGEVEFALRQCEGVLDAIVLAVPATHDEKSSMRLVGCLLVAARDDAARCESLGFSAEEDRQNRLRSTLPYYMVPTSFVTMADFPLTANGKVDRKVLMAMAAVTPAKNARSSLAPRDALENTLFGVWQDVLEIEQLSIEDNLFELGGDSLTAAKLASKAGSVLGIPISLQSVFVNPSILGMAENCRKQFGQKAADLEALPVFNAADFNSIAQVLLLDAQLDPDIRPDEASRSNIENPRHILLTGATGFLGAYVLKALLEETEAQVYCLARPSKSDTAMSRIKNNLSRYGLWQAPYSDRIIAVPGDLSKEKFALDDADYAFLCTRIDVIHHVAAEVSYARSYQDLKKANVTGARSIIRLACADKLKAINFVSSKSVCLGMDESGIKIYRAEEPVPNPLGKIFGYTQSKWVAEKLFEQAGARGVPVAIFRPGHIGGAAENDTILPDDAFYQLVNLFMAVDSVPNEMEWQDGAIEVTPVDFIARAIVAIGAAPASYGKHYHLTNPNPMSIRDFFEMLEGWRRVDEAADFPGVGKRAIKSYRRWVEDCVAIIGKVQDRALAQVLLRFFSETDRGYLLQEVLVHGDFLMGNVDNGLRGSGITCPCADDLFRHYYLPALTFIETTQGKF